MLFLSRMYRLLYYNRNFFFDFDGIVDGKKSDILCNYIKQDKINSAAKHVITHFMALYIP